MDHLETEARNPASTNLDDLTSLEIVHLMNGEDAKVIPAVASQAEAIARAIEVTAERLRGGGRLIYAGAGTSGRLGVLDATECPPTFNAPAGQVIGIIAGGPAAVTGAVEGAEDHPELAERDLAALDFSARDVLVGIATSGRTPYVLGAIAYARRVGAFTIGLSCNADSELIPEVELAITPVVGPEVLSGSTRLKAGTATKLVLNMLTTGAMVRLGKVFGNLMVDLRATNDKLRARTNRIVRLLTGLDRQEAGALLERCDNELKTALVSFLADIAPGEARRRLYAAGGQVRAALAVDAASRRVGASGETPFPLSPTVVGIDGGGTHTVALLAQLQSREDDKWTVLGRGEAGPSNLQAVGTERAVLAIDEAVSKAFQSAALPRRLVQVAWLGLAGAGRPEDQELIRRWALQKGLAADVEVTPDAPLLLAAGTSDGWGVAVVAGTGSIAFARAPDGRTSRAGGWGYLLGDEGSGYALSLAAFQAVVRMADGRGPDTLLARTLLDRLQVKRPEELIAAIYRGGLNRPALAALAPLVLGAAEAGDAVAGAIVQEGADQLALAAATCARQLELPPPFPLALAGGLLLASASYRERLMKALEALGIHAEPVTLVPEPAEGAVRLAVSHHLQRK
ncbi:MAG TPA: N-acetylmuramic acid 6-phosphate etherase [Pirellulales bacterium]|jgi:N-acetylmuramic acid 6-phosphate etherase|nr:N-acetylmuramic acid 6-phosphate etherase [Pirellulales bacterium]